MMKKTIATLASAALVLTNVVSVAAATNENVVTNTGAGLQYNSAANNTTVVTVSNTNNANVAQTDIVNNDTGHNTESNNINLGCCATGAGIVTGNAGSVSNQTANLNSNSAVVVLPSNGGSNNSADVANTGANASVNLSANSTTVASVVNQNNMNVAQTSVTNNNTGYNVSNANIGTNGILTGDAVSLSNKSVTGNNNTAVVAGLDGNPCNTCTGNHNLITNTGSGLSLNSSVNETNVLSVFNSNNMFVAQTVLANNNTGFNVSDSNIGNGVIMTGNAGSVANFAVSGNDNEAALGLDLPMGSNLADVLNTGINATLNLSANNTTVAATSNANNYLGLQTTFASNTSGLNTSHSNVGAFGTFTGAAGTGSNFMAGGNHNTTLMGGAWNLLALLAWL